MLKNGVYRLKQDVTIYKDLTLKAGQEIEVVSNVVYMQGFPLPPNLQPVIYNWLQNNQNLLINDTRNF